MKWGERICCHTFTPTHRDDRYSLAGVHVLQNKSRFWPDPVALLQKNCLISCKLAWEKVSGNKEVLEIHSFFSLLYFSVILLNYALILLRSLCLNHNVLLFLMTLQKLSSDEKKDDWKSNFNRTYSSMIPKQCFTYWAIKPTGSWSLSGYVRYPWKNFME